jgi:excinuclease ABC subunit B
MLDLIGNLEKEMRLASKQLEFERAAELRDMIVELKGRVGKVVKEKSPKSKKSKK